MLVDVVLVTGRLMPKPDPESHLLIAALHEIGVSAALRPWDDATDWAGTRLVVVRTPWDYADHRDEFLEWATAVSAVTRLVNPVDIIEWNSHKGYLLELARAGVPAIETVVVAMGAPAADRHGALTAFEGEVVIKPAVSVGAIGALRTTSGSDEAAAHLDSLVSTGDALVQPFARTVLDAGEVSLIYFGERFSHAVRKIPAAGEYRIHEHHGGRVVDHAPTAAELAVGAAAVDAAPSPTTYARVDMVNVGSQPSVMELEVIEPELFLRRDDRAPARFASHLAALLG